jgi:membrane-associated phospholipid phosphatase
MARLQEYVGSSRRTTFTGRASVSFLMLFASWWVLLIIFNRFSGIDLDVARAVFTESGCGLLGSIGKTCGSFLLDKNVVFVFFRSVFLVLPYLAIAILLGVIFLSRWRFGRAWRTPLAEMSMAALATIALGCGVLVNLVLKEFSGRPRPRDTVFFGGDLDFVQAGSFAGKCLRNCSFVSGEASSAGWLLCLIVLLPSRWRFVVGIPLAIVSIAIPTLRVLTGAHYLSDAVLGWLSSLVVFAAVLAVFETTRKEAQLS